MASGPRQQNRTSESRRRAVLESSETWLLTFETDRHRAAGSSRASWHEQASTGKVVDGRRPSPTTPRSFDSRELAAAGSTLLIGRISTTSWASTSTTGAPRTPLDGRRPRRRIRGRGRRPIRQIVKNRRPDPDLRPQPELSKGHTSEDELEAYQDIRLDGPSARRWRRWSCSAPRVADRVERVDGRSPLRLYSGISLIEASGGSGQFRLDRLISC